MSLYKKLDAYHHSDHYAFHMPGHKRNTELFGSGLPYGIDITEIEGFDDLHHAEDILKRAQERAARLYHADDSYFLVNGSTGGILSAILGSTCRGDRILAARNCHKSVYHAIMLNELRPVYLYPQFLEEQELNGPVLPEDVKKALDQYPDIRAVVLVSPTYDGVVSDVAQIAQIAHERGIPVIVDEAHGAHFGMDAYFPQNSNTSGADMVIHSVHKTLPALTQTALLHINGTLTNRKSVESYLHMLQTSSPSYVLMSSIDTCLELLEEKREVLFSPYTALLEETRKKLKMLSHFQLVETESYDRSKLVISVKGTGWNGQELYQKLLERFHLQMEMAAGSYVLAMTSVGDTREGMDRLVSALQQLERELEEEKKTEKPAAESRPAFCLPKLEQVYLASDLLERSKRAWTVGQDGSRRVSWKDSVGGVSMEYAYLYPPGIPMVVPGERISQELVEMFYTYRDYGFEIHGLEQEEKIEVLIDG